MRIIPEVECAYHPTCFQKFVHYNTYDTIIVATAHRRVWMGHDDSSHPARLSWAGGRPSCRTRRVWMVYATIEGGVVVY